MAHQVSGSAKSLLEAIRDGDIEAPQLMRWNTWQQWRRDVGRRPTVSRDGEGTVVSTTAEELALYKSVMEELHGEDWATQLATGEEEATAAAAAVTPRQPTLPGDQPADVVGTPPAPSVNPGSGESRPGAAGPGSGLASPVPSWNSRNPGTPTRLTEQVFREFVPGQERLDVYCDRIKRQANGLRSLGEPLAEGVLEILLAKANYAMKIVEDAPNDVERQLRLLKREFAMEVSDPGGNLDQQINITALEQLLESRGLAVEALRAQLLAGADFISTPVSPTPVRPFQFGTVGDPPQFRAPSPWPAANAGAAHHTIHTDSATPLREDARVAALEKVVREQEAKLAAHDLLGAPSRDGSVIDPGRLVEVLDNRNKMLEQLAKPRQANSTIRVEPKFTGLTLEMVVQAAMRSKSSMRSLETYAAWRTMDKEWPTKKC